MSRRPGTPANRTIRQCRDVVELLTEYVEGGLAAEDARRLETHLADCSACVEYLDTLKKTRDAVGTLRSRDVPEECRRELRSFLKKALKGARR
jgi:anti-sigma factor (TIGR02949 family)